MVKAADDPVGDVLLGRLLAVQKGFDEVLRDPGVDRKLLCVEDIARAPPVPEEGTDAAQGFGERSARFSHRQVS
jgi:hypothetical protein